MMDNGASGYVIKNASRDELIKAINAVLKGDLFLSHEAALIMQNSELTKIPIITRREKEVILLISKGLTNNEIAEKLFISTTTVDTHRKNLLIKFEAKNTAALVRMAFEMSLI